MHQLVKGLLTTLAGCIVGAGASVAMPPEYAEVFWPAGQPAEWRTPDFVHATGFGAPTVATSFDAQVLPAFWGTRITGDVDGYGRGQLVSDYFEPGTQLLLVPVMGNLDEQAIALEAEDGARRSAEQVFRVGRSIEMPRFAQFRLAGEERQRRWRVLVHDHDAAPDRWIAVASPIPCRDEADARAIVRRWRDIYRNDFTYFLRVAGITFALIGLPLLAAVVSRAWIRAFWVAVGGAILGWVAIGLLRWGGFDSAAVWGGRGMWWLGWAAAAAALMLLPRLTGGRRRFMAGMFFLYLVSLVLAHLQTVPDVPVVGEYAEGTLYRGRIVASPPDHMIPFLTATFLYHRKDGREQSDENREAYFARPWSLGSRGPLLPLVITGLFVACDEQPHDPPFPAPRRWPADDEAVYVARAAGIAFNGLAVLAMATLAALLVEVRADRAAFAAAAVAVVTPFVSSNVVFVWPKLMVVTAVLFGIAAIRHRRGRWWPVMLAAGYYAHPLAGLFFPALALLETLSGGSRDWRGLMKMGASRSLIFVLLLAPWIIFKIWLGHPDVFWIYVLGDGRDIGIASSVGTWLECRWLNGVRTFVPFAAWLDLQPFRWFEDTVSGLALWTTYTARTLFGQLGLALSVVLFLGSRELWHRQRALLLSLAAAGLTITVYWGYSNNGLGRQCLEPITAVLVALGATLPAMQGRWLPYVLGLAGAEFLFVTYAGIDWGDAEAPGFLLTDEWPYAVALVGLAFAPSALALVLGPRLGSAASDADQSRISR